MPMSSRRTAVLRFACAAAAAVAVAAGAAACHRAPSCDPKTQVNLNYTLKDMNGAAVSLASYHGRPLLLNFWATWCGPCKEEIPALVDLTERYRSSKIAVLGISIDDAPADLKKFAEANHVNYPLLVGLGHDDMLAAYGAEVAVPVSWFVSANGCALAKHEGAATKDWFEQQIRALL
jgi:peroxiredoxin